ncbi:MAG TPA: VTT domain-containing protein [Tissierellales bacterium]|nr:VTT domain-containing protein [Tissierellales bacterium]
MKNVNNKKKVLKVAIMLTFIGVLLYLIFSFDIYNKEGLENFFKTAGANRNFSLFFFIITTILVIFFVPISWFSALGAFFFGMKGFIYVIAAGMIGATVSFYIARIFQYDVMKFVNRLYYRKKRKVSLEEVSAKIEQYGIGYVFFIRSMPFIPFSIANFVSGVTTINVKDYLLGTLMGLGPGQLATTYFFTKAVNIKDDPLGAIIAALIKGGYVVLVLLLYRKSKYKTKE